MSDQPLSARLVAPADDDLTLAGFDPAATLRSKTDAKDQLDDDIRPACSICTS